jgi:hypothetical protein
MMAIFFTFLLLADASNKLEQYFHPSSLYYEHLMATLLFDHGVRFGLALENP